MPQIFGFLPLPCSLCVYWNFRYRCGADVCPGRHAPFQILPGDTLPNEMHDQLFNPHMTCGYLLLTTFKWRLIQRGSNTVTNKKQLQENRHKRTQRWMRDKCPDLPTTFLPPSPPTLITTEMLK